MGSENKIPILIISYLFPPRGGVGVQRIVKFIKYLPEHGFFPIVLTVKKPSDSVAEDTNIIREVSADVPVFRTSSLEPYHIYRALGGRKRQDDPSFRAELVADSKRKSLLSSLYFEYQRRFLIPDPKIGWLRPALKETRKIFEQYSPRLAISTSPESTAHLISLELHRRRKLPYISDFRDPWTSGYYSLNRTRRARDLELSLEEKVLENAGAVTVVMRSYIDSFLKAHPSIPPSKFHIIPNGFDEDDYKDLAPRQFNHFTLAHTGSVYHQRSPIPLFEALKILMENRSSVQDDFRLFLLGQVDREYFRLAVEMGVSDLIIHERFAPHSESLAAQLGANALLLLSEGVMTAKVYEYFRARKPIIGFAPKGELSDCIEEHKIGRIFETSEHEKAASFLIEIYDSWKAGKELDLDGLKGFDLTPYERKNQTAQLARVCKNLLD